MEKTPRYTQRERNMVLGYAAQYKDVIENKRTDAESNRKKDEVWLQIANEFNSRVYHKRTAKQLRQLYKNMKLLLKKDLCGDDKGNRSFMDLLNTLSQQDSVAQYIADQMSPDGAGTGGHDTSLGGGGGGGGVGSAYLNINGRSSLGHDDYDDTKLPPYESMDTDVILIKSETISDNEQTEHGMDDDEDDDDDCLSPKAPEVCLEEEDEILFATDLRQHQQQLQQQQQQQQQQHINGNDASGLTVGVSIGGGGAGSGCAAGIGITPRATSSPSVSSTGSYLSGAQPKTELGIPGLGNIRVGAFANINKTLQNGNSSSSSNCNSNNNHHNHNSVDSPRPHSAISPNPNATNAMNAALNAGRGTPTPTLINGGNNIVGGGGNGGGGGGGGNNARSLPLTAEQVQQHLLLNGLGLSAVHPPPQSLQAAINAATSGLGGGGGGGGARRTPPTLHLPRLQRGHNNNNNSSNNNNNNCITTNNNNNSSSNNTTTITSSNSSINNNNNNNGMQLLLNGSREKQTSHNSNGYIGSTNTTTSSSNNNNNSSNNNIINNNTNNNNSNNNNANSSSSSSRGQHSEYMMTLAIEERKRKIELLNVQITYWQTLTKKLDTQPGHTPSPSCLCHFPGNMNNIGCTAAASTAATAAVAAAAAAATAASATANSSTSS